MDRKTGVAIEECNESDAAAKKVIGMKVIYLLGLSLFNSFCFLQLFLTFFLSLLLTSTENRRYYFSYFGDSEWNLILS